jgi:hypothetical protein
VVRQGVAEKGASTFVESIAYIETSVKRIAFHSSHLVFHLSKYRLFLAKFAIASISLDEILFVSNNLERERLAPQPRFCTY